MKKIIAIILCFSIFSVFGAVAFADGSPEGSKKYNITIEINGESKDVVLEEGDTITLVATDEDGFTFEGWEISGDYEIVEGDESSKTLVIRPLGDLEIIELGTYEEEEKPSKPSKPGKPNDSETSPPTGTTNTIFALGGLAVLFLAAAVVAKKKAR